MVLSYLAWDENKAIKAMELNLYFQKVSLVIMNERITKMSNILKVTPDELKNTCSELQRLSSVSLDIANQFRDILQKLQFQWEGDSQQAFDNNARLYVEQTERFALMCKEYSADIMEVANSYVEAESLFANNVNGILTIIE